MRQMRDAEYTCEASVLSHQVGDFELDVPTLPAFLSLDYALTSMQRRIDAPCRCLQLLQVHQEVNQRWMPAATPAAHAERLWQIANTNNPFRCVPRLTESAP
jgi:hypothetical protein